MCNCVPTKQVSPLKKEKKLHVGVRISVVLDLPPNKIERASRSDNFHALSDLLETARKVINVGSYN
jgi:hypothetical protein